MSVHMTAKGTAKQQMRVDIHVMMRKDGVAGRFRLPFGPQSTYTWRMAQERMRLLEIREVGAEREKGFR